ncbi:MAG: hypothetical protein CMJ75_11295 [Planctomycetaceae bacterium]|nr:hypothetical protein [Planctomycetaceae bacterium]
MNVDRLPIDSDVLGASVLQLDVSDGIHDLSAVEADYLQNHRPGYVFCRVPVEDLATSSQLESHGFRFVEFQLRSELRLKKRYPVAAFPYRYEPVANDDELQTVQAIAAETFVDDRWTVDPHVNAASSQARYRRYLEASWQREDEYLHKLTNPQTGEIVGFNSARRLDGSRVQLLLAGIAARYKGGGLGTILNYFVFNDFLEQGLRRIRTHHSGRNYAILNLELGHFQFRVVQTFVVLRKCYERPRGGTA